MTNMLGPVVKMDFSTEGPGPLCGPGGPEGRRIGPRRSVSLDEMDQRLPGSQGPDVGFCKWLLDHMRSKRHRTGRGNRDV